MMKNGKEIIVLEFNLPEFNQEEIKVKIEKKKIFIEAKKQEENHVDEEGFKWFEKTSRNFSYSSSLPPVEEKKGKIEFVRGRLRITIPKKNGHSV